MTLEDQLFKDIQTKEVPLERALFIASGLETEEQITEYTQKLDQIQVDYKRYEQEKGKIFTASDKAESLFNYFWDTKPNRYNGNFTLTDVVDAQLSEDKEQKVGNCVGLTSLYTVLSLREGLSPSILISMSNSSNHVKNRLRQNGRVIEDIDNVETKGFDLKDSEEFVEFPAFSLVATVYNNHAVHKNCTRFRSKGSVSGVLEALNKAIEIEPKFFKAYSFRAGEKEKLGDLEGAKQDYDKAIEIEPRFSDGYVSRGNFKQNQKDYNGAWRDYTKALQINPENTGAYEGRGSIRAEFKDYDGVMLEWSSAATTRGNRDIKEGNYEGSIRNYESALKLNPENQTAQKNLATIKRKLAEKQPITSH